METTEIWNKYSEELHGFLLKKTGDNILAEDILHETFIKLHLNISQLRSGDQVRSWVYRIAHNSLIDHYRTKQLNAAAISNEEEQESSSHSAEDCLLPIIKKLPSKYREAILLSDIKGYKQNKVAEMLGISLSGTKSRIQRARKMIQEGFVNCCDYTINEEGLLEGDGKTEDECRVCS